AALRLLDGRLLLGRRADVGLDDVGDGRGRRGPRALAAGDEQEQERGEQRRPQAPSSSTLAPSLCRLEERALALCFERRRELRAKALSQGTLLGAEGSATLG